MAETVTGRPRDVFLAYAGRDRAVARAVRTRLEQKLRVFLDVDTDVGGVWPQEIPEALRDSALVAFLLSRDPASGPPVPISWYVTEESLRSSARISVGANQNSSSICSTNPVI